jgi:hypothetical protein
VNLTHVTTLRTEMFGKIYDRHKESPNTRIAALEKRMNELEEMVLSLTTKN